MTITIASQPNTSDWKITYTPTNPTKPRHFVEFNASDGQTAEECLQDALDYLKSTVGHHIATTEELS